jgi:hypothetical protein
MTCPQNKADFRDFKEEDPLWRGNFPVIRGNDAMFLRITGKYPLQGIS